MIYALKGIINFFPFICSSFVSDKETMNPPVGSIIHYVIANGFRVVYDWNVVEKVERERKKK